MLACMKLSQHRIVYFKRKKYFLFPGFLLDKKIGVNQPKRLENAKILIANTPMDAVKIKVKYCFYFANEFK